MVTSNFHWNLVFSKQLRNRCFTFQGSVIFSWKLVFSVSLFLELPKIQRTIGIRWEILVEILGESGWVWVFLFVCLFVVVVFYSFHLKHKDGKNRKRWGWRESIWTTQPDFSWPAWIAGQGSVIINMYQLSQELYQEWGIMNFGRHS